MRQILIASTLILAAISLGSCRSAGAEPPSADAAAAAAGADQALRAVAVTPPATSLIRASSPSASNSPTSPQHKDRARARQAGGGARLLLDAGQGPRRQAQARHRQFRQGDRSRCQGWIRLGDVGRLRRRSDRRAVARPSEATSARRPNPTSIRKRSRRCSRRRRASRRNGAIRPRTALKCAAPPSRTRRSIDKLGLTLVRVLPDNAPPDDPNAAGVPAHRHAVRQSRLRAAEAICIVGRRPDVLHARMRAAGRSPAISAALRRVINHCTRSRAAGPNITGCGASGMAIGSARSVWWRRRGVDRRRASLRLYRADCRHSRTRRRRPIFKPTMADVPPGVDHGNSGDDLPISFSARRCSTARSFRSAPSSSIPPIAIFI